MDEDMVGEGEGVDLPDIGHPVVVHPPDVVHVDPQVPRWIVGKQSLRVSKINLDFPKPQK